MATHAQAPMFVRVLGLPWRVALCALLCLTLMAIDARTQLLDHLRAGFTTLLHPLQVQLKRPFLYLGEAFDFFQVHARLLQENRQLRAQREQLSAALLQHEALQAENARLRALLALAIPADYRRIAAELVQIERNPFAHKVVIDRGSLQGISPGWPVVDAQGLVGQVTRVYPLSSEVSLITAAEQEVPVQVVRNGLRLLLAGGAPDRLLEVRFLDKHADLQPGDLLVTSGLDGLYPPGLPVARVLSVEPPRHSPFARAVCAPLAEVDQGRHLFVLQRMPTSGGGRPAAGGVRP
ncbi:MAG: rod shape-determining protein MreC [Burkholderiales bacterium]|nr:rod shape-determining protein MreC [Burkholderiales bacterium]